MKKKILCVLFGACFAASPSFAATLPAGTLLFVETSQTIASDDPVGKTFAAQVARDVVVSGKVVLRAGTKCVGRIESRPSFESEALVLNVTQIARNGRYVPIKTEGGFATQGRTFKTRRGVSVGFGGVFLLPTGTQMQFRLAQSVKL